MFRNHFFHSALFTIMLLAAAGCGGTAPQTPAPTIPLLVPTNIEQHPSPTTRVNPTPTQVPVPTLNLETGQRIIEPGNSEAVVALTRLGKGSITSQPVYSADGLRMAIPTSAGIYFYDVETHEALYSIPVGSYFIALSSDGKLLAASGRGAISLWDTATGAKAGELISEPDVVYWDLSFSPDGSMLSAVTWENEVYLWSLASGERLFSFPGNKLGFSPDGELAVVVVYGENRVQLYETHSGTELNTWNAHHAGFTPSGQIWLEAGNFVRLLDTKKDTATSPFNGIQPSFSMDGSLMALFGNQQIWLYDPQNGRRIQMLEGRYVHIDNVMFSPDGQTVTGTVDALHCPTCSELDGLDRYVVLWRAADGSILARVEQPSNWLSFSTDSLELAVAVPEIVQFVRTTDGSNAHRLDGFTAPVAGMALAPDGMTLAAVYATNPYTLRFWDLQNGRVARELMGKEDASAENNLAMAYSPKGDFLAVRGDLWDLDAGEELIELEHAITAVTSCLVPSVAFAPQKNDLATGGCFEGKLDLWSVPSGTLLKRLGKSGSWVEDLAYSPDGERLAAIYTVPDFLVQVWQLPDEKAAFALTGGHFTRVTYSPDGSTLATVMANPEYDQYGWPAGFVQLWSASDGKELAQLEVDDAVSIAFSPDSQILATGSLDGTLRLWKVVEGDLLFEDKEHYTTIQRLAFTPDGTRLITGSLDGTILQWGFPDSPIP